MSGQPVSTSDTGLMPGEVLARTREELGITQREVSDALNLPLSTVAAIETGDKAHLPALVFTRGYVRAYAKLLELDADPLVAALGEEQADAEQTLQTANGNVADSTAESLLPPGLDIHHLLKPRNLAVGGGVLLILVVLVAILMGGDDSAERSVEPPVAEAPVTQIAPQEAREPVISEVTSEPAIEAIPDEATELELEPDPEPEPEPDVAVVTSTPVAVADPASLPEREETARRLTAAGDDRLSLLFTEDCWVEIKDTADNTLFGDLGRAGQELEFVGGGPFRVLLGYAPGVLLKYNNEPIALTPHTRNNVASLVLGQ